MAVGKSEKKLKLLLLKRTLPLFNKHLQNTNNQIIRILFLETQSYTPIDRFIFINMWKKI